MRRPWSCRPAGHLRPATTITTEANDLVTPIHNRMPAIPGPYTPDVMAAYQVSPRGDSPGQFVEGLGRPALVTSTPAGTLTISRSGFSAQ